MMKKKFLGLDTPKPGFWDEHPFVSFLGAPPYIPEGRETFLAQVPNRFKKKETIEEEECQ